jgi:TatD DNase family protein
MHCYTGSARTALKAAERGYYIGFAGPVTYPGSKHLRELAAGLPPDRILAETDSPYLPPQPVRGRRNEPAYLVYTVEVIAESIGMDLSETALLLRDNSRRAFQMGPEPRTDLIYRLNDIIYMNITGMCGNRCRFCIRDRTDGLGGYHLRHSEEPGADQLRRIMGILPPGSGQELVFCGYGEPTMRPDLLRELAESASSRGYAVRLNTNGTCLLRMDEDEVLQMLKPFRKVSVSLNAPSRDDYERICRPSRGGAWESILRFVQLADERLETQVTAVRYPGVDIKAVQRLADSLGLPLRIR